MKKTSCTYRSYQPGLRRGRDCEWMLTPAVAARNVRRTISTASSSRSISDGFIPVVVLLLLLKREDSSKRGRRCERGKIDALCSVLKCLRGLDDGLEAATLIT